MTQSQWRNSETLPAKLAAAAALTLLLGMPAFAASAEMEALFGNTVVQTSEDGTSKTTFQYDADGTVTRTGAAGSREGTWEEKDGQLCETFEATECWTLSPGKGVGDSWEQTAPDGNKVTITIVKGQS